MNVFICNFLFDDLFFCRDMGALAAMEYVQCELWRGGEGTSA